MMESFLEGQKYCEKKKNCLSAISFPSVFKRLVQQTGKIRLILGKDNIEKEQKSFSFPNDKF